MFVLYLQISQTFVAEVFKMGIKNKRKASVTDNLVENFKRVKETPTPEAANQKNVKKDKAKKVNLTKKQDIEQSSPASAVAATSVSDAETTPIVKLRKPRTKKAEGGAKEDVAAKVEKQPLSKKKKKKSKKAVVEVKPKDEAWNQERSLEYLELWKNDRETWKFHKLRQIWLVDNMLDSSKVSWGSQVVWTSFCSV